MNGPDTVKYAGKDIMKANQAALNRQSALLNQLQQAPVGRLDDTAQNQSDLMGEFEKLAEYRKRGFEKEIDPALAKAREDTKQYIADMASGRVDADTQRELMKAGIEGAATAGLTDFKNPDNLNSASNNLLRQLYGRGWQSEKARRMGIADSYLSSNPAREVAMGGEGAVNYEQGRKMYNLGQEQQRIAALLGGAQAQTQGAQEAAEQVYTGAGQAAAANANARNAARAQMWNTIGGIAGAGVGALSGGASNLLTGLFKPKPTAGIGAGPHSLGGGLAYG